jgi:hypothetical protein
MFGDQHTSEIRRILSELAGVNKYKAEPSWEGRPLWPCPGLKYQPAMDEQ